MKNISIFQGIVEFKAPDGNSYRAERVNGGIVELRKLTDNAWLMMGKCLILGKVTPAKIWEEICEHA